MQGMGNKCRKKSKGLKVAMRESGSLLIPSLPQRWNRTGGRVTKGLKGSHDLLSTVIHYGNDWMEVYTKINDVGIS